jgi:hypothetical protein
MKSAIGPDSALAAIELIQATWRELSGVEVLYGLDCSVQLEGVPT